VLCMLLLILSKKMLTNHQLSEHICPWKHYFFHFSVVYPLQDTRFFFMLEVFMLFFDILFPMIPSNNCIQTLLRNLLHKINKIDYILLYFLFSHPSYGRDKLIAYGIPHAHKV
jgi:hypothetical protein